MSLIKNYKIAILVVVGLVVIFFARGLTAVNSANDDAQKIFVRRGEGLKEISNTLYGNELIKSRAAFQVYAFFSGKANKLKPGVYEFFQSMSTPEILNQLVAGGGEGVEVLIKEGATVKEIDEALSANGIIENGELIKYQKEKRINLEGFLFPDTYEFNFGGSAESAVKKFFDNFNKKTMPLISGDAGAISLENLNSFVDSPGYKKLILASILEKEVPDFEERKIVAGILEKRLKNNWSLQVDASLCYIKQKSCYPLTELDKKIDSPYNTYTHKGLPITPIGNPGISAIKAALEPQKSQYWYYLSDSETKKTIFAKTLEEHARNRVLHLK